MASFQDLEKKLNKYTNSAKDYFSKSINQLFEKSETSLLFNNSSKLNQDIKIPIKRQAVELPQTNHIEKDQKTIIKKEESQNIREQKSYQDNKDEKQHKDTLSKNDMNQKKDIVFTKQIKDSPIKKKKSISSSSSSETESENNTESEEEYNANIFMNSLPKSSENSRKPSINLKLEDEELKEVFSSDSDSIFDSSSSSDEEDSNDLNSLISKLKSNPNSRIETFEKISKLVSSYPSLDNNTKNEYKPLLISLETIKLPNEDSKTKARLIEIIANVKKLFNSISIEEDWPRLTERLKSAVNKNNKSEINNIFRRTLDAFPEEITGTVEKDIKPMIDVIRKFTDTAEEGETKKRGNIIINKWMNKTSQNPGSNLTDKQKIEKTIRDLQLFDFENENKKSVNIVDASKTVPKKHRRNKYA
ncbi:hypothetical protein SteCoe_36185 [Stentor coeruleus]|uniref:Uncharacterized protein n=1 Tax=Stentor coeruleus TaxID=5963 RepID=A0A1R2AQP4_9CILI|nr:hypothetical protein SteCoe_36185 [Stentor coeruleus]